jgi:hypothetical protein
MRSTRTRAAALGKELLKKPREISLQLAELLAKVQDDGEFQDCWAKSGISKRTAYYLAKVVLAVKRGVLSRQAFIAIGWTKCQVILAADVPPARMDRTIEYARGHTVKKLRQHLGLDAQDGRRTITLRVTLDEEQCLRARLRELRHGPPSHQEGEHGVRSAGE